MKKLFTLLTLALVSIGSAWGATGIVSFEFPNSYLANTSGSLSGIGCDITYSGIGNNSENAHIEGSEPGTYYLKMTSNSSAYVQISLSDTSDKFQPGDVLTIDAWINSTSTSKGFKLHNSSGNLAAATGTAGVQSIVYTLVAADIEEDGSIKLYRVDSSSFLHGASVSHTASDGRTNLTGTWSATETLAFVGETPSAPTFTVSAGTLGTDYTVEYTLLAGTVSVNESTGITSVPTYAPGRAVVRATINVLNTAKYKVAESEYTCSIMVRPTSWNFINLGSSDKANMDADANWTYNSAPYYVYDVVTGSKVFDYLVANDSHVEASFGLQFARNNANGIKGCFRFYDGKGLNVQNSSAFLKIPSLKAGDVISVDFVSSSASDAKNFLVPGSTNITFLDGMEQSANASTIAVANYTVNADGDVVFNLDKGYYIRGIAINSIYAEVGEYEWATFVSEKALDFTGSDVKAYIVTDHNDKAITKSDALTTVAANTPLLLNASKGTYVIPVAASGTDYSATNLLKAGDGNEITAVTGKTRYVLGVESEKATFLKIVSTPATVPTGKAYLEFNEEISAREFLDIDIDGVSTGINMVNGEGLKVNGSETYYDLQGRRVLYPTKGLYIVNGKKVVIK